MHVKVEVILFRLENGLKWRRIEGSILTYEHPDETALRLSLVSLDWNEPYHGMCHSTSWRYDTDHVVLTYAILPDPDLSLPCFPLGNIIAASDDPLRPSPPHLKQEDVAVHALHHIAALSQRDPTVRKQVEKYPELWGAVLQTSKAIDTIAESDSNKDLPENYHVSQEQPEKVFRKEV